jgi:hypothetical protein
MRSALVVALLGAMLIVGACYHGNPPAPCDPHCTDPMAKLDGGVRG